MAPCRDGIHACRPPDLPFWVNDVLYEIELDGEVIEQPTKVVAPRARLLRRLDAWDDLRVSYTRMCADRALKLARSTSPPLTDWAAVVEPSVPEGPALLGFVAARISEEISGVAAAERGRQADWLAQHLSLGHSISGVLGRVPTDFSRDLVGGVEPDHVHLDPATRSTAF